MGKIDLSVIVAMTPERVIGINGKLSWNQLPSDLARFKKITMETGVVVMGCKTYESILHRSGIPLPDRKHIVLTRKRICSYVENVYLAHSVEEALKEIDRNGGRACVIGGGEIYKLFLEMNKVTKAYITTVYAFGLKGDTYFPETGGWNFIKSSAIRKWDPNDEYETMFEECRR